MDSLFLLWFGVLVRLFRGRGKLVLENLALRQQLNVLKRRHPRPRLDLFDKLFWVIAQQFWSTWKEALIVVTPETVQSRRYLANSSVQSDRSAHSLRTGG